MHCLLKSLLWLPLLCVTTHSYRILLIPTPFQSHLNYFVPFGKGLVESNHEVHIVLSSGSKGIADIEKKGIHTLLYHPNDGVCQLATDEFLGDVAKAMFNSPDVGTLADIVAPAVSKECDNFLLDDGVLQTAQKLKFDLAVVDGLFFARCLYLFPARLRVPFVTLTTFQEVWPARIPAPPSHVPFHYSAFQEKMSFFERLINTVMNTVWILKSRHAPQLSPEVAHKYALVINEQNYDELVYQSQLWFYNSDLALEYPKPTMPNVVSIGGMSPQPSKPLEPSLQEFMDSSKQGVVVVSFGSVIQDVPQELNERLVAVFSRLRWNVLWRNKNTTGLDLPANVRAMKWLPQNDVLGHPNTVAFVTHCGNNGQFEALYHKVPMVGFPIFADQPYNARRIEARGYGIGLKLKTFTVDELVQAVETVALNQSYRDNIARGSKIMRGWPETAQKRAAFWVEHIIENGADHLRTHALNMPWYEYLLLDVAAFLLTVVIIVITLSFFIIRMVVRKVGQVVMLQEKHKTQ